MTAEWYYRTSTGRAEGPVTAAHLKQLAQLGEIGPETEIRKGAEGRWVTANKVKGLLDPTPPKATTKAPPAWQQPVDDGDGSEPAPSPSLSKSPPSLVRKPPVVAESDDEDDRPVPARRTSPSKVSDSKSPVSTPANKRLPLLLFGVCGGGLLLVGILVVWISDQPIDGGPGTSDKKKSVEKPSGKTGDNQPITQDQRYLVAIKAAEDAIAGKSVRPQDYGVTEDEIFDVFKAKIATLSKAYRAAKDQSTLASLEVEAKRLLSGMERVNPNHEGVREFREAVNEEIKQE